MQLIRAFTSEKNVLRQNFSPPLILPEKHCLITQNRFWPFFGILSGFLGIPRTIYFGLIWMPFWIQNQRYKIYRNWDTHPRFIENGKLQMMTSRWCSINKEDLPRWGFSGKITNFFILTKNQESNFFAMLRQTFYQKNWVIWMIYFQEN